MAYEIHGQGVTAAAPKRASQVEDQMRVLEAACECLEKTISAMEERLCSVTVPGTPLDTVPSPPEMPLVPVADRLRSRNRHLDALNNRLRNLTDRIEL